MGEIWGKYFDLLHFKGQKLKILIFSYFYLLDVIDRFVHFLLSGQKLWSLEKTIFFCRTTVLIALTVLYVSQILFVRQKVRFKSRRRKIYQIKIMVCNIEILFVANYVLLNDCKIGKKCCAVPFYEQLKQMIEK